MQRKAGTPLGACTRIAASQHGVISADQALRAGLSVFAIRRLVRAGAWDRVLPTVYGLWTPADREARWRQRLSAASLWLGPHGAVSHRAAATVLRLDGIDASPIEVVTKGRHRPPQPGYVVHRVTALEPDELVVRDGIRVTGAPRTLVDLCAVVNRHVVELALESALRRRVATIERVRIALQRAGRARGKRTLEALLAGHPGTTADSALEVIVWVLVREGHLPPPVRQYEARSGGRLVGRVDLAYPDAKLAIEADGHEFHSSRRDWQRDRSRQNALVRLGWTVYRVTWEDATLRPGRVIADVSALLRRGLGRQTENVRDAYVLEQSTRNRADPDT